MSGGLEGMGPRKFNFHRAAVAPDLSEDRTLLFCRLATALQLYLLYSALQTTAPKQATEEDPPRGTAGGRWGLSPSGYCVSSAPSPDTWNCLYLPIPAPVLILVPPQVFICLLALTSEPSLRSFPKSGHSFGLFPSQASPAPAHCLCSSSERQPGSVA